MTLLEKLASAFILNEWLQVACCGGQIAYAGNSRISASHHKEALLSLIYINEFLFNLVLHKL